MNKIYGYSFDLACKDLTRQVEHLASQHCPQGWVGVPDYKAPCTLAGMQTAFAGRLGYPVSHDFCDTSIYGSVASNMAFRAWHDAMHVTFGLDAILNDEIELGLKHVRIVQGDFPKVIMFCDTVGQSLYESIIGDFPTNQRAFVYWLSYGLQAYLADEGMHTVKPGNEVLAIDFASHAIQGLARADVTF